MIVIINNTEFIVDRIIYVDPNGDDNNDGLTKSTPFRTISKAWITCSADDAICLMEGIHHSSETGGWYDSASTISSLFWSDELSYVIGYQLHNPKLVYGFKEKTIVQAINGLGLRDHDAFTGKLTNTLFTNFVLHYGTPGLYGSLLRMTKVAVKNVYFLLDKFSPICDSWEYPLVENCHFEGEPGISYYPGGSCVNSTFQYQFYPNGVGGFIKLENNFVKSINLDSVYSYLDENTLHQGNELILNPDGSRSNIGLLGGPFSWDSIKLYKYFLTKNDKILNDNVEHDINSVTLNDFLKYGYYEKEQSINSGESIIFASKIDKIPLQMIQKDKQIISNKIDLSDIKVVKKIEVNGTNIDNIKCLINNGYNWYTYKDSKWEIINEINNEVIKTLGININEIKNISNWNDFFEKNKFIMFNVLLTTDLYDVEPLISNIKIEYNENPVKKTKINDDLYSVTNYQKYIELIWKTADKESIEIILKENKGVI